MKTNEKKEFYRHVAITENGIQIMIKVNDLSGDQYSTIITTSDFINHVANYFDNLEELVEHVKEQDNMEVDLTALSVRIVTKTTTKKTKSLLILEKELRKNSKNKIQVLLQNIHERCNKEQSLTNGQVKFILSQLAIMFNRLAMQMQDNKADNLKSEKLQSLIKQQMSAYLKNKKIVTTDSTDWKDLNKELDNIEAVMSTVHKHTKQLDEINNQNANLQKRATLDQLNHQKRIKQCNEKIECLNKKAMNLEKQILQIRAKEKVIKDQSNKEQKVSYEFYNKKHDNIFTNVFKTFPSNMFSHIPSNMPSNSTPHQQVAKFNGIQWIDRQSPGYSALHIKGNQVTAKSGLVHIFGKNILVESHRTFWVEFLSSSQNVEIGIIDKKLIQTNRYLINDPHKMYIRFNGYVWDGVSGYNCQKLHIGQKYSLELDYTSNCLRIKTGQLSGILSNNLISNGEIDWVPYICLSPEQSILIGEK